MAKILVTGVNGFVGKHLVRELVARGIEVVGVGIEQVPNEQIGKTLAQYCPCDLTSQQEVASLPLAGITAIINLAGFAAIGASFDQADEYIRVNTAVVATLCDRLQTEALQARMIAISSGAVYDSHQPMPLNEDSKTNKTTSPYAASKLAMEEAALKYRLAGVDCAIVRPFNHIGPGQRGGFLVPDLFAKIQAAGKSGGTVAVGNLTTRRDYTDVRDVVRAYADLAIAPALKHQIYNVCSGKSVAGKTILELLLKETGQAGKINVKQEPGLIRPDDPKDLFGSNQRLRAQIKWEPSIPIQQTLHDFVVAA